MSGLPTGAEPIRLSDAQIDALLGEDLPGGDLTTRALAVGDRPGRMSFVAREDLVLCGSDEARRLLEELGAEVTRMAGTGEVLAKGAPLLDARGSAAALLAGWKAAQTIMEWASGIATSTRRIVDAAHTASPNVQVLCTRKATPLTRQLSWKAVIAGGGELHRLNLSDTILLFPEHRAFFDRPDDIKTMIARLRAHTPERAIMIEVKNEADAMAAAEAHADVIQLEKFTPDAVHRVVQGIRKREDGRPIIAAAGGVNAKNAADYARAGADTLVTSAPYHAPPVDIQVEIVPQ